MPHERDKRHADILVIQFKIENKNYSNNIFSSNFGNNSPYINIKKYMK